MITARCPYGLGGARIWCGCSPGVSSFPHLLAREHGPGYASSDVVYGVGRCDPGLLHFGERLAAGILQLRGMAGDCDVVGAWHSACRGIGRRLVTARAT